MSKNPLDPKLNDLKEEFKIIEEKISNWDKNSLSIKNWAITVWSAIIVFISTQYYVLLANEIILPNLFLIPILLPLPFWLFDGLYKKFQRLSVIRSQAIQDYLNKEVIPIPDLDGKELKRLSKRIEKLDNKSQSKQKINNEVIKIIKKKFMNEFPIYDPMSRMSKKYDFFMVRYHKKTDIFTCMLVRIVAYIYCILLSLSFFIYAIVVDLIILLWIILPFAIILISWYLSQHEKI